MEDKYKLFGNQKTNKNYQIPGTQPEVRTIDSTRGRIFGRNIEVQFCDNLSGKVLRTFDIEQIHINTVQEAPLLDLGYRPLFSYADTTLSHHEISISCGESVLEMIDYPGMVFALRFIFNGGVEQFVAPNCQITGVQTDFHGQVTLDIISDRHR